MRTHATKKKEIRRKWYLVDAKDKILGRLATRVAFYLMGKHKVNYAPYLLCGDAVVVINADKVAVTGKKKEKKIYYRHSEYPGGLKKETLKELMERKSEEVIRRAVKGMLPKTKLGREMIKNLYVYKGEEYKQEGQKPEKIELLIPSTK